MLWVSFPLTCLGLLEGLGWSQAILGWPIRLVCGQAGTKVVPALVTFVTFGTLHPGAAAGAGPGCCTGWVSTSIFSSSHSLMLPLMEQMRWTLTSTLSKVAGEPCRLSVCPSVCPSAGGEGSEHPCVPVGVSGGGWSAGLCAHPQWEMAPGQGCQGKGAQREGWGEGG